MAAIEQQWSVARSSLGSKWDDARARSIDSAHLVPVAEGLSGVGQQLGRQEEAHRKGGELCRIAGEQAEQSAAPREDAKQSLAQARELDVQARVSVQQAQTQAAASRGRSDAAVRRAGAAGSGCGQGLAAGDASAELNRAVMRIRKRRVYQAMAKAGAVEVAWELGPKLAEDLLERVTGAQGISLDGVRGVAEQWGPLMHADVKDVIRIGLRSRR